MPETNPDGASDRKRGLGVKLAYDQLRDDILELALAPGSPIDEVQIAERLSMSRTPIREALVRLAAEGLVTALPNRSTVVAPIDFLNLHTFFDALTLMYRVTTRLAAENRGAADLAVINRHQAAFAAAVGRQDARALIDTNRDFHTAISQAGGNPYYAGLLDRLLNEGRRLLHIYYSSYDNKLPEQYVGEHEEIIAAIQARDVARSDRLATAHADQIVQQIQSVVARDRRHAMPL